MFCHHRLNELLNDAAKGRLMSSWYHTALAYEINLAEKTGSLSDEKSNLKGTYRYRG